MKLGKRADCEGRSFRVFPPWDLLRGRDVFKHVSELDSELEASDLAHFAPNCATFSRAREIPIKGVRNPPKPLRSSSFPLGIPEEVERLSKKARTRLSNDSHMAQDSAVRALARHREGKLFSLEHPLRSIAMDLPEWKALKDSAGVYVSEYHTCMFEGSRRKKSQALIHNVPELRQLEKTCGGNAACDRTGGYHERWRPVVAEGKVKQYITGEEREYPLGFCRTYADCIRPLVQKERIRSFVEIYSGPNAPLSNAISLNFRKESIPAMEKSHTPQEREKQTGEPALPTFQASSGVAKSGKFPSEVETSTNRVLAVAAGRQPSFGKRTQVIKDGINDPLKHLEEARKLIHPFDLPRGLKAMHEEGLKWSLAQENLSDARRKILKAVRELKSDAKVRRRDVELKKLSGPSFRLGQKMDLGLMEALQDLVLIEDKAVPLLCATGMPITGVALESPFFVPQVEPQKVTTNEFLRTAKSRRNEAMRRTKYMAKLGGEQMARAIWEKAQKEISEGSMGRPMTLEEAEEKLGGFFNVIPCFGLHQGSDSQGNQKYRRIDDHTAGWVNLAAKRMQRIEMANTDYIATMVKSMSEACQSRKLHIATADMKAAYRQIALAEHDIPAAITAIFNPSNDRVELHEMFAQPFGAGHAVPNFYRVAEWLCRLVVRLYGIQCDHFFDDYWIVDLPQNAQLSLECLLETANLLGIAFDPEKTQQPTSVAEVLGVVFDMSEVEKGTLYIKAKPKRAENLITTINGCIDSEIITPSQAASIVGKFGFLCPTLFGKAGRCASLGVRARQYTTSRDTSISDSLLTSLRLMQEFLSHCPPRRLRFHTPLPPFLLYSDASDVPERHPRFGIGGVLVDQRLTPKLYHFSWAVPTRVVNRWVPKKSYMGQLEILAGPISISTWHECLSDAKVFHFVDNDAASSCLVRGYSPKVDSSELVGVYWLMAASSKVSIYIDRVESKSNLSDGPSRFDNSLLDRLGSLEVTPVIPQQIFLDSISSWFQPLQPAKTTSIPVSCLRPTRQRGGTEDPSNMNLGRNGDPLS